MSRSLIALALATSVCACSSLPGEGRGGMAEFEPLTLAFWDTQSRPTGPADGLKFEITLLKHQLDLLVLEGAKICFPASVAEAKLLQQRMMREYNGGLLLDAANSVEIQQPALVRLERRLDRVLASAACQLEVKTDSLRVKPEGIESLNRNNQFAFDSATITPAYRDQLVRLLPGLKAERTTLLITGHTDPTGSEAHNQQLAQKRAEAVADLLIAHGISAERIELNAVSASQPYEVGKSPEHHHSNRRVTIERGVRP